MFTAPEKKELEKILADYVGGKKIFTENEKMRVRQLGRGRLSSSCGEGDLYVAAKAAVYGEEPVLSCNFCRWSFKV